MAYSRGIGATPRAITIKRNRRKSKQALNAYIPPELALDTIKCGALIKLYKHNKNYILNINQIDLPITVRLKSLYTSEELSKRLAVLYLYIVKTNVEILSATEQELLTNPKKYEYNVQNSGLTAGEIKDFTLKNIHSYPSSNVERSKDIILKVVSKNYSLLRKSLKLLSEENQQEAINALSTLKSLVEKIKVEPNYIKKLLPEEENKLVK